jgi:hypothetical protein
VKNPQLEIRNPFCPLPPRGPGSSTTEELIDRHADLAARGLANCRAAQSLRQEINRRITLRRQISPPNQVALSNWEFDPKQSRDRYGKWTAGDHAGDSTTNNPAPTNLLTPLVARPAAQKTSLNPIQNLSAQVDGSRTNSPSQTNTNDPLAGNICQGNGGYHESSSSRFYSPRTGIQVFSKTQRFTKW